jgi:hypothetical protein
METEVAIRCFDENVGPLLSVSGSETPHWGQKPIHFGERYPQVAQLNVEDPAI